jgi:glycosyltransferase involved in cell wall biosynthesis
MFYSLSNSLLLYGNYAVKIGISNGFTKNFMHPIYNSLDYDLQQNILIKIGATVNRNNEQFRSSYFLVVGRLVESIELDILFDACGSLPNQLKIKIVGDGPERERLEKRASEECLPIDFLGPIYDEEELCRLFIESIAVVSPGKVGLLAMHAMGYGIPVITHSAQQNQMPEFESLDPEITGFFYNERSCNDLSNTLIRTYKYMSTAKNRYKTSERCTKIIEERYTPAKQVEFIEKAIFSTLKN